MARLFAETVMDRRKALVGFGLAALTPLGCLSKNFTADKSAESVPPPSPGQVVQAQYSQPAANTVPAQKGRLVANWDKRVRYAPDSNHGGKLMPGLVCRVYLFGPDMTKTFIGDGDLIVDLHDSTPHGPGSEPKFTDELRLDAGALRQFAKTDGMMGDGYTIFFPWANYNPGVKQVFISMLYTSANKEKFFDQQGPFAVDHAETMEGIRRGLISRWDIDKGQGAAAASGR
jgi:hypothetical protein